jgi:hypothetical protein
MFHRVLGTDWGHWCLLVTNRFTDGLLPEESNENAARRPANAPTQVLALFAGKSSRGAGTRWESILRLPGASSNCEERTPRPRLIVQAGNRRRLLKQQRLTMPKGPNDET